MKQRGQQNSRRKIKRGERRGNIFSRQYHRKVRPGKVKKKRYLEKHRKAPHPTGKGEEAKETLLLSGRGSYFTGASTGEPFFREMLEKIA